jgi:hypothetical protein
MLDDDPSKETPASVEEAGAKDHSSTSTNIKNFAEKSSAFSYKPKMGDSGMCRHALAHAARGFSLVMPSENEKSPRYKDWQKTSTRDPALIRDRWSGRNANANIGIMLGEPFGDSNAWVVLAIDVDMHDCDGWQAFARFKADYGIDDTTLQDRTPSGGGHILGLAPLPPPGMVYKKIIRPTGWKYPGVDLLGHGCQVLAAGSIINGKEYRWVDDTAEIKPFPQALLDLMLVPESKPIKHGQLPDWADDQAALELGIEYLKSSQCPQPTERSNHNEIGKIGARFGDFGISPAAGVNLMLGHWHEGLDEGETLRVITGYQERREKPFGIDHPMMRLTVEEMFECAPLDDDWRLDGFQRAKREGRPYKSIDDYTKALEDQAGERRAKARAKNGPAECKSADEDPPYFVEALPHDALIEPRQWIVENMLARKFVTAVVGDSGTGKTQWTAQLAVAIAAGKNLTGHSIVKKSRIWTINNEDDQDELNRRISAARRQHEINDDDLQGDDGKSNLIVGSGVVARPMLVERAADGTLREGKEIPKIIATIKRRGVDILDLDPVIEFHQGKEGDNNDMNFVVAVARRIAVEANCAVLLVFHTRKPPAGDNTGHKGNANALRGASSQNGVARITLTVDNMSLKEARDFKIAPTDKWKYVSVTGANSPFI